MVKDKDDVIFNEDEMDSEDLSKELESNKRLSEEYEDIFDDSEKLMHKIQAKLGTAKGGVKLSKEEIEIDNIVQNSLKKLTRTKTLIGLTESVAEMGVLTPIHVLKLESDDNYLLLDGLRRVYAAIRAGIKRVPAIVVDFRDKETGKELAVLLSLLVNRSQAYHNEEIWELFQHLEDVEELSFSLIEYLLQLNSGEAMKLKDVMTADDMYAEIREGYLSGELTIEGAFKKLTSARKKEDKLAKEDVTAIGSDGEPAPTVRLSDEEAKSILEMDTSFEGLEEAGVSLENATWDKEYQTTDNRKPLSSQQRMGILQRDEFTCQCCKLIKVDQELGVYELGLLAVHHIIPVFASGSDDDENLVTVCVNCHMLIHQYINGELKVDKDKMPEQIKEKYDNILKYGNKAILAAKKLGLKRQQVKEASAGSTRHPYPSEILYKNMKGMKASSGESEGEE